MSFQALSIITSLHYLPAPPTPREEVLHTQSLPTVAPPLIPYISPIASDVRSRVRDAPASQARRGQSEARQTKEV
jgi:hypothetical protein